MIASMRIEELRPNDYNPNRMTKEEAAELLAEIRHLGRLPKPVVVRPDGAGYVIVDGEQSWRVAQEAGLAEVACEVIEADDFEAMRQTYKRNQHGTHHPVLLGRMFRRMLETRGLSQRALAEEIAVSEGTIRNALAYAEAAALRNGYAFEKLTIRQVRAYVRLPRAVGDLWLDCGADLRVLYGANSPTTHRINGEEDLDNMDRDLARYGGGGTVEDRLQAYSTIEETGLLAYAERIPLGRSPRAFEDAMKTLLAWNRWECTWAASRIPREELRQYTRHYFGGAWPVQETWMMDSALNLLIDATVRPAVFRLTPDEFAEVIAAFLKNGGEYFDFEKRLALAVRDKTGRLPDTKASVKRQFLEAEVEEGTPDYIRQSALSTAEKYELWQASNPPDFVLEEIPGFDLDTVKRQVAAQGRIERKGDETTSDYLVRLWREAKLREERASMPKEDLAWAVVERVPLYDKGRQPDAERRATLAATLTALTRDELLWFRECVERLAFDAKMAALFRRMMGGRSGAPRARVRVVAGPKAD